MNFPLILNLYKKTGETPLERIERFKKENPRYEDLSMTYAGRLDPIAEGVLVVLAGERVHEKEAYLKLEKEYVAHILLGFQSDTYDILGFAERKDCADGDGEEHLRTYIKALEGKRREEYPPYSSRTVKGLGRDGVLRSKPLWQWADEGSIEDIDVPAHEIEVKKAELLRVYSLPSSSLLENITGTLRKVEGSFRQDKALAEWRGFLSEDSSTYNVAVVQFHVSSGTYIRSLARRLGTILGCGATLLSLTRTHVGDFSIHDSIRTN